MKDFLKYVLATVVGIIVVSLICTILSVITLLGMASKSTKSVPSDAVLVLKLEGSISERSQDNPLGSILGSNTTQLGLDEILKAIRNAQNNDKVKGIYIEAGDFGGATPAQLQEIRQALLNFKKSGKFIVSYGDQYTQGTYYLASVADSVVINPEGMLDWKGLAFQTLYYKDVLDKVGVKMEIFKVGTYKSAVEPYFLTEMSDANREQITVFSDEIWKQMQSEVAKSRKFSSEQLNQLTDEGLTFKETNYYLKKKLVDKVAFSDEVPQMLAYCMDKTKAGDYNTISVTDLAASTSSEPKGTSGNVIAVYYAAGDYTQDLLTMLESNVKSDRTDLDLLFGCLLEWGLPLSMPYKSEKIDGCTVHTYAPGDPELGIRDGLIACFDASGDEHQVKEAYHRFDGWLCCFGRLLHFVRCRLHPCRTNHTDRFYRYLWRIPCSRRTD